MNILTIQYKNFKSLFSKEICIYTLILIFHLMRKTVFNKARNMGDTSVDSSTFLLLICIGLNLSLSIDGFFNIYLLAKNACVLSTTVFTFVDTLEKYIGLTVIVPVLFLVFFGVLYLDLIRSLSKMLKCFLLTYFYQ